MQGISAQELAFAYRTGELCEVHAVERAQEQKSSWEVVVFFPDKDKKFVLQSVRGTKRNWRNFERMMNFIRETCPEIRQIVIDLEPNQRG
ncbi:hypothetical protein CG017_05738 (plasmid) [Burkholderia glumae]|nr:hypothetical protein CG017_05738 [Burkholderia glumae]